METISINFQIPSSWSELSDKQLRSVYQLHLAVSEFFCKKSWEFIWFFDSPPIFAKNYQRNDNECYNS